MLHEHPWMKGLYDLRVEQQQAYDEGKDLEVIQAEIEALVNAERTPEAFAQADSIYARIQQLPQRSDFLYMEPDTLPEISALRRAHIRVDPCELDYKELYDRILAAWQGRCVGCLFGQPVEGWKREKIRQLLIATNNWPVSYYMSSDIGTGFRNEFGISDENGPYGARYKSWINNISEMPVDDDTSYTVFSLNLLERYGRDFTPEQVGDEWLSSIPLLKTCTAERMAYINMSNLIVPPLSASTHNPYREWIGAQIRTDLYGYINPGDPQTAAEMAWRDASISHVKNGIYGAMYIAAMTAAAYVLNKACDIVLAGLGQIPSTSRLYDEVMKLVLHHGNGGSLDAYLSLFYQQYSEDNPYHWCHTIPNALLVTAGLLYHDMAFVPSMTFGTIAGFDTDCNSATIGSIIGIAKGTDKIEDKWTKPLNGWVNSFVSGYSRLSIPDLAKRTLAIVSFDRISDK